jgi:hypothetical protein
VTRLTAATRSTASDTRAATTSWMLRRECGRLSGSMEPLERWRSHGLMSEMGDGDEACQCQAVQGRIHQYGEAWRPPDLPVGETSLPPCVGLCSPPLPVQCSVLLTERSEVGR